MVMGGAGWGDLIRNTLCQVMDAVSPFWSRFSRIGLIAATVSDISDALTVYGGELWRLGVLLVMRANADLRSQLGPDFQYRHASSKRTIPQILIVLCPHKLVQQIRNTAEDLGAEDTIEVTTRRSVEIRDSIEVFSTTFSPDYEPSPYMPMQISAEKSLSDPPADRRRAPKRRRTLNHGSVYSTASLNPRCGSAGPDATYSSPQPSECTNHMASRPSSEISSRSSTPVLTPDNSHSRTSVAEIDPDGLLLSSGPEDHLIAASNRDLAPVPASVTSATSITPLLTATKSLAVRNTTPKVEPSILNKAKEFFELRLRARSRRALYLVRAVQGFMEVDDATLYIREHMWAFKSEIFDGWEDISSIARFRRLYEGHQRIKLRREEYACADRFCYIFLEHDLDQLANSGDLILSQGRGRKTAAFHKQAESISSTVNAVRANRKAGRGYLHLLIDGGPGFVLLIGSQVSTIWERKLSRSDILLILEFLKTHLPEIYAVGKSLDVIASQALVDGFVAYGWNRNELLNTESTLIDTLKSHLAEKAGAVLQTQPPGFLGFQQPQGLCVSASVASEASEASGIDLDLNYCDLVESDDEECSSVSAPPVNYRSLKNTADASSPSITQGRERQRIGTPVYPSTLERTHKPFSASGESEPSTCNSVTTGDSESDESMQTPTAVIGEHMAMENLPAHSTETVCLDLPTDFHNVEEDELWNWSEVDMQDIHMLVDVPLGFLGPYEGPISQWNNLGPPTLSYDQGKTPDHEGFWDLS
ncbi:hypothetical protein OIDMADRAFT_33645 [Oidiodendron maius Zn]|uniref:Uncharacterized protein n=1 Tax=Oidiodendron maius (strain Zn) TaxID=913774 RepID=A0A0C3GHD1_OIDMZ|nr:hypothetical protein OIDMADRAFT_33645 [Oidiodendron maius Zn]